MDEVTILHKTKQWVYDSFHEEPTGHDFWHMQRVANVAKELALEENADPFICELAGWLHDMSDTKLFIHPDEALKKIKAHLQVCKLTSSQQDQVLSAMEDVSFRGKHQTPKTLEGKIVQDADRLDALGAIGIARTFAYGGAKGQLIYNPNEYPNTSIQHFYDKLLSLKELMNTEAGKKLAATRHYFMEQFLEQFYKEWTEGTDKKQT